LPRIEKFVKEHDIRIAIHNHGPEDKLWHSPLIWLKGDIVSTAVIFAARSADRDDELSASARWRAILQDSLSAFS
jgi:hypothetical protein